MSVPAQQHPTDSTASRRESRIRGRNVVGIDLALSLVRMRDAGSADVLALNALMLASPSHRLLTQGRLPSALEGSMLFATLPVGARREDKFLWGAWRQRQLVGCIEVIRHWPTHDCGYIGSMVVAEIQQRKGLGTEMLQMARQQMRGWHGVRRMRLAVTENNQGAIEFWRRAGFRDTGQRDHQVAFVKPLVVMERPLT